MAAKGLKPASAPRPDAAALHRVAEIAGRTLPPAVPAQKRQTVVLNLKVGAALADALAARAERDGSTQKMLICRALAGVGLPVDPLDLQDRTKRRVRAST